jgi:hypothetical protein
MSGIGSFSPEAYEQLQQAYASQLARADEIEEAGVKVGADTLGVETVPIKSDWLDKTGLWKYPDGRGEHMDVKQKQQDLLAALRNEDGEVEIPVEDEEPSLDEMTNEQVDQMIDEILSDLDDSEDSEDSDEIDNTLDSVLSEIDPDEESSDSSIDEMTDEELDAYIDQLVGESEPTAEDIAIRIEELKAQLSALTESDEDTEDTEDTEEPEETQGEEEETESELPPEDEE